MNPKNALNWKTASLGVLLGAVLAGVTPLPTWAGPVGLNNGFENDDGNLTPGDDIDPGTGGVQTPNFDWNSFDPTTWTGTAPNRQSDKTFNGFTFKGIEDAQVTTSDSAFDGGTKQDDNCASVGTGKAPNKDDLKRIYLATKTIDLNAGPGFDFHTFLDLAWVRIPQNTTSPSAHIGFEFNRGSTPCPAGSDGLVQRSVGDLLIVYDFEGGAGDAPVLTLRRWTETAGAACEVGSESPPCWGLAVNLTAGGFAEGKVNTFGSVTDLIAPTDDSLGTNEFGEASIDLTGSGVFGPNQCLTFGKAFGVSRSSGNSGTAQMKDLIGPGDFTLQNCGDITIIKRTDPRGENQSFDFTSNITTATAGTQLSCTADATPAAFSLNDDGNTNSDNTANTEECTNVLPGGYSVTEGADPTGFEFDSLECTASGTGTTAGQSAPGSKTANITLGAGGSVTCVYVNKQQLGAIKVSKTRKHAASGSGDHPHSGVNFTVDGVTKATDANGEACFDNLPFGDYTVHETVPAGYSVDANDKPVTVGGDIATCSDDPYVGETVSFANTPLTDITVSVNSQVDGGTASTVACTPAGPSFSTGTNGDGSGTTTNLAPGIYTCTINVDP